MNLENLVCSLESAKRLKELGVPQESLYQWVEHYNYAQPIRKGSLVWDICPTDIDDKVNHQVSAFTAGELGEMLPCFIYKNGSGYLACTKHPNSYKISYGIGEEWIQKEAETEAEARAKMLIYLLENNLMKLCTSQNTKAKPSQKGRRRRSLG